MSDYKIGFWNYMNFSKHKSTMPDEWKELGYNYAMTPLYTGGVTDKADFCAMLKRCEEIGIEVVLKDTRTAWQKLRDNGEESFRKGLRDAVADFGKFKSVHSFFVGDEPSENEMDVVANACRIIREECSGIKAFLAVMTPISMPRNKLKDMLIKLIKEGELEFLVYNCYSQCLANEEQRQQGIDSYFSFLNMFRDINAACDNIPIWISLLGVGHWFYRCPTQEDMRWQLNTAAMYGIKGFIWFYPYDSHHWAHGGATRFAVNFWGDKTDTFGWMREEDLRFNTFVAPLLSNAKIKKVYQHWQYWIPMGGTDMFERDCDEIISDVSDVFNRPIIITRFSDANKKPLVAVTNGSQTDVSHVSVSFKGKYAKFNRNNIYLAPGGTFIFDFST